ncbi:AAA family ATPase [Acinetobacter baumannii]|uniref:ATP-dependent nuclease n=1 Tax=Acinetobacter seifertii TaxID=1530123 RepID=UPI001580EB5C|nr:AAA family ATPase [Acinetobacter seifertii]EHU2458155.1 AAA family ATPase [Acinetobacter baumannii]MDA4923163.1 AAA family ATPase [Acinetobacter baumannii]NUE92384.1 AAA family ATPase [Acinetobacter seifertii]
MYLAQLNISNFRKLSNAKINFQPGLNILVGPNNVGKTAIIDALRALLAGHDEPYPQLDVNDIHCPKDGASFGDITFEYIFRELSLEDEADFLAALVQDTEGKFEVRISVRYSEPNKVGRLRVKRWCGDQEENNLTIEMLENLRGVYLPALRDASQSLRPGRASLLARLFHLLADDKGREDINIELSALDDKLKKHEPLINTNTAIISRHDAMLGSQLSQLLEIGLSVSDFQRLASRLSLSVDNFDIEQNGLGFNNLIFMAVVLSELSKNTDASYRGLIVEEPEAHLHPQLQAVLLRYLESVQTVDGEKPVQIFVTSHSPNFASIADLNSLICLVDTSSNIKAYSPTTTLFKTGKREKLKRYLDVTRAELFFARRVIFVEGAAELMLINILADKAGFNLREHGVSLISVEGLNFDCFLPLFGENALNIKISVITDADPSALQCEDDGLKEPVYPSLGEEVEISSNTKNLKEYENNFVRVFHGVKTFEYDFALYEDNRFAMIEALKMIHPKIAIKVQDEVSEAVDNSNKARALFSGMFERSKNMSSNVQKGKFSQALAEVLTDPKGSMSCVVPEYIINAIEHVCDISNSCSGEKREVKVASSCEADSS